MQLAGGQGEQQDTRRPRVRGGESDEAQMPGALPTLANPIYGPHHLALQSHLLPVSSAERSRAGRVLLSVPTA